jgi:CrcB protein
MDTLKQCLAIGGAGFFGALARFFVGSVCGKLFSATTFPVGTLVINLTGSLFLGWFLTGAGTRFSVSDTTRLAIAVGFVGAYTTFSTYMYESSKLLSDGETIKAMANLIGSVVLGLICVRLGMQLAGGK